MAPTGPYCVVGAGDNADSFFFATSTQDGWFSGGNLVKKELHTCNNSTELSIHDGSLLESAENLLRAVGALRQRPCCSHHPL